ncbi:hypothetical protein K7432_017928, partial [Basidiobolus ranarum]
MGTYTFFTLFITNFLINSVTSGPIYFDIKSPAYYPLKDILIPPSKDASTVKIQELEADGTMDRLIIVGDLHGSLEYFDDLLKKIDFDPKIDKVVLA